MTRRILQVLLPFLFIIVAVLTVRAMVVAFSTEAALEEVALPRSVEVVEAQRGTHTALIQANGTVEAHRQVDIIPQVQGLVVRTLEGLAPGLPVRKGAVLIQVDDRDYRNNLVQAEANLARAELELAMEESRASQAAQEWALLGEAPPEGLATRAPQVAAARAAVESARAAADNARLAVERTVLRAPFDGIVIAESVEVGQLIAPGASVLRLVGTDRYRVRLSLPSSQLRWIDLPDEASEGGSEAEVVWRLGDGHLARARGRVARLLGELDPQTRTAGLLVLIDPSQSDTPDAPPILPGAWVSVTISGRSVPDLVPLSRSALADDSTVLIADEGDTLRRRRVSVAFGTREQVFLSDGVDEGERVIVTPMSLPVEGMALDVTLARTTN